MKLYVSALFASGAFVLAACGGGGSSPNAGGGIPTLGPSAAPSATPTPGTTIAQGTLVDDPSGAPLAGVSVQLDPWIAYPTPGPTPTPILTTTTDNAGHFTVSAKNGTYLLVIGSDAVNTPPPGWSTPAPNATDTPIPGASGWRATIHDRIVLTGGGTASSPLALVAPTMPPQPLYTPPAVETSGKYRLLTLDALTESPCILAWNTMRTSKGLSAAVADEWSFENAYAMAWVGFQPNGAGEIVHPLTTANVTASGGSSCAQVISSQWSVAAVKHYALDEKALWFGGAYFPYGAQHSGYGATNFAVDPRLYVDPSGLVWP